MNNNRTSQGIKKVTITFAGILYAVAVVYGDIMFLSIVSRVFPSGLLGSLAMIGAFVAGGTALLLPLALHWWHAEGTQQIAGYVFYMADFAILGLNAILAYKVISGGHLDTFFAAWLGVCPATPIICAVGWGILFSLDPSHKARHAQENLNADLNATYAQELTNAAQSPQVKAIAQYGAQLHAWQRVQTMLGVQMPGNQQPQMPQIGAPQTSVNEVTGKLVAMPKTDSTNVPPDPFEVAPPQNLSGLEEMLARTYEKYKARREAQSPLPEAPSSKNGANQEDSNRFLEAFKKSFDKNGQ